MNLIIIGRWAFLLGLLVSLIAGFGGAIPYLASILFILGLAVGFLNITERESSAFLIAVITLLLIGIGGLQFGKFTQLISNILQNLIAFVAAAGFVVAIKQVLVMARKAD